MKKIVLLFCLLFTFSSKIFAYENEKQVICAIVSKIAKFTQKNNSQINPYTITVLNNQFGALFTEIFKGILINNKPVQILYIDDITQLQPSNILFIFDMSIDKLYKTLSFLQNKHILTISTMQGFAQRGGMVQIYEHNQKLHLKINLESLKKEGIYMSSALLRIVTIVKGEKK